MLSSDQSLLVRRAALALLAVLVAALVTGAGAVRADSSGNGSYRIGPKDLVEVHVFEVPELNVTARVSEAGTLNLPLIGEVPAAGLTETDFAARLKQLLEEKYVQRASVAVEVKEFRSRPITLIGAVKTPGNLAFSGRWSLLEALAAAGGLGEGHGEYIYVMRRADNGLSDQLVLRLDDLMIKGDPRVNIPIFAGDMINVPATVQVTVFCLGEVARPGSIDFKSSERISVLSVIARAGGLSERASKKILVKRRKGSSLANELEVDYKRILSGKDPDVELEEGDVLVVKESIF